MSELCFFPSGSPRAVLSPSVLTAIQSRIDERPPGSLPHAIDFELRPGGVEFGVVPVRALPTEWSSWPVSPDTQGVGLCLPVEGAGHLGVLVMCDGDAAWFVVDDEGTWGSAPSAGQLLDDACRTRLGLLTAPPEHFPDWYWLGQWLSEVVDVSSRLETDSAMLDVITVATAHAAVDIEDLDDLDMAALAGFVVTRHRDHVRAADWSCIHLDALTDAQHPFHKLACGLEVGPFSRWVSAASPPLSDLAAALTSSCTPLGLRLLGAVISDMVLRARVGP